VMTLCGIQIGRNWLEYVCAFFYTLEMSADCLISGDTETKKYTRAVNGVRETQGAFEGLSASVSASQNQLWGVQYDEAMEKRGEFLRIFEVKESKGIYKQILWDIIFSIVWTAPSLAEMRLDLTKNENRPGGEGGVASWLGLGIALEDAQYVFQLSVLTMTYPVNKKGQIEMGSSSLNPVFECGRQDKNCGKKTEARP